GLPDKARWDPRRVAHPRRRDKHGPRTSWPARWNENRYRRPPLGCRPRWCAGHDARRQTPGPHRYENGLLQLLLRRRWFLAIHLLGRICGARKNEGKRHGFLNQKHYLVPGGAKVTMTSSLVPFQTRRTLS